MHVTQLNTDFAVHTPLLMNVSCAYCFGTVKTTLRTALGTQSYSLLCSLIEVAIFLAASAIDSTTRLNICSNSCSTHGHNTHSRFEVNGQTVWQLTVGLVAGSATVSHAKMTCLRRESVQSSFVTVRQLVRCFEACLQVLEGKTLSSCEGSGRRYLKISRSLLKLLPLKHRCLTTVNLACCMADSRTPGAP